MCSRLSQLPERAELAVRAPHLLLEQIQIGLFDAYTGYVLFVLSCTAADAVDTLDDELIAALSAELAEASGKKVFPVSAAGVIGIDPVLDALLDRLHAEPVDDEGPADEIQWSPI